MRFEECEFYLVTIGIGPVGLTGSVSFILMWEVKWLLDL